MSSSILSALNLVKVFGSGAKSVRAVDGLSLEVREGICFGLLGPNGAGKTTTIEMMEGILKPTAGQVLFRGHPTGREFAHKVGIQFQQTAIQDRISTREVLELFARFYKKSVSIEELIETCKLSEFLDREPRKLSGGQRQRVLLALALVNDPEVVFLDEPTTGLDPQARRNFWDLVTSIKARGKTIILTTHYMEEAETLCDEIAIVDRGKLLAHGTPDQLIGKNFHGTFVSLPAAMRADLSRVLPNAEWKIRGDSIESEVSNVNSTLESLVKGSLSMSGLVVKKPTLEDLFIKLTGRNLRE